MKFAAWMSRPYDLRQAFLVCVLLPLAGLSATVVLGLVNWAERSLEARLQGEIELISRAVAPAIGRSLGTEQAAQMGDNLESLFSIRGVYGAAVYDHSGELVVSAGIADPDLRDSREASDVVRTGEEDGSYRSVYGRYVYAYFTPLLDHGGRIHGLLQITRDRREIDASIRELRTLAWTAWLGAVTFSVLVTLLLYRRLVGRRVSELLERMGALAAGERRVSFQAAAPREFARISAGFNAMVASIRDAEHALRDQEAQQRALERQLQASERVAVVGRVTQGLAHELGAPLSVIDGWLRRLDRTADGAASDTVRRAVAEARRQVVRMTDIVRQLLNYGRLGSRDHEPVRLGPLLERLRETTDPSRVHVRTAGTDVAVHGDPVRLELALSNLINNGVRHARSAVHVRVCHDAEGLTVLVSDDGPGVDECDRDQVFQPFFTRQPAGEGSGLGLAIVASVMHEHDGTAQCRAGEGSGACFVLQFPASRVVVSS